MATRSWTIGPSEKFPVGTSVAAYPVSNWPGSQQGSISGAPVGSSAATATVAADGTITFTGLTLRTPYVAYASVSSENRYLRFLVGGSGDPAVADVDVESGTTGGGAVTQSTSPWVTADQADGTPGSAAPSKALQAGGTDGTNLRAILVDANGQVQLASGGAPGSAVPSRGVQVGGTDGTNLRALLVDAGGSLIPPKTGTAVTGAGTATVGVASAQIVASTATRKGFQIVNDSANTIYLGLGTAAVVGSGVRLNANGGSWDGKISGTLWTGAVNGIATAASSNACYVEV